MAACRVDIALDLVALYSKNFTGVLVSWFEAGLYNCSSNDRGKIEILRLPAMESDPRVLLLSAPSSVIGSKAWWYIVDAPESDPLLRMARFLSKAASSVALFVEKLTRQ